MSNIGRFAIVSSKAKLGSNVIIKDFAVIEDDVILGDDTIVEQNAIIKSGTSIGRGCRIYNGAVIGADPQDLKYHNEPTRLFIDDNTIIREYATIARGTAYSGKTTIGKNTYIMNYSHVAHDDVIGDNVILVNNVEIAGHVTIEDWVYVSTFVGIHQFVKIGRHSLISYISKVTQDIPPFIIAGGSPLTFMGLNIVGLRRRGFSNERIAKIKEAYRFIYSDKYNVSDALKAVKDSADLNEDTEHIIRFIENSERGIVRNR